MDSGNLAIRNSIFRNNIDDSRQTGTLNLGSFATAIIESSTFVGNQSYEGGAILSYLDDLVILDCDFIENSTPRLGGAIRQRGDEMTVSGCRFQGNYSGSAGGAIYAVKGDVVNCLFVGNRSEGNGGALQWDRGQARVFQSTFVANRCGSGFEGGAISNYEFASEGNRLVLSNSILWDNGAEEDTGLNHLDGSIETISTNNLIEGVASEAYHTYSFNPSFVRDPSPTDGDWNTLDDNDYGDLRLSIDSRAIGAGSNDSVPVDLVEDMSGNPRIQGIAVDLGPFETNRLGVPVSNLAVTTGTAVTPYTFENWLPPTNPFVVTLTALNSFGDLAFASSPTITSAGTLGFTLEANGAGAALFQIVITDPEGVLPSSLPLLFAIRTAGTTWKVSPSGEFGNHGLDWNAPLLTIQDALARALPTDQIWVASGTYKPTAQNTSITLVDEVEVYGGFQPEFGRIDLATRDSDPASNGTVLSGDLLGDDTPDFQNRSDNCVSVVTADDLNSAVLDGFTISGGGSSTTSGSGGGIRLDESSLSLSNLHIVDNRASSQGGGIYMEGDRFGSTEEVEISDCLFEGNQGRQGGGIFCSEEVELTISGTLFFHNHSEASGGAIYGAGDSISLVTSRLLGNSSLRDGGALFLLRGNFTASSCIFVGNHAVEEGGALMSDNFRTPVFRNCTIAENRANQRGGGTAGRDASFFNSIIWGNSSDDSESAQIEALASRNPGSHSTIEGWTSAFESLVTDDPLFARPPDSGDGSWTTVVDNDYGDLRLLSGSKSINTGLDSEVIDPEDILGEDRIRNTIVDRGAVENLQVGISFSELFPALSLEEDLNGNGVSNYVDYATGLDPTIEGVGSAVPEIEGELLTFFQRTDSRDAISSYLHSIDLLNWSALVEGTDFVVETRDEIEPDRERVTFRLLTTESKDFFCARIRPSPIS